MLYNNWTVKIGEGPGSTTRNRGPLYLVLFSWENDLIFGGSPLVSNIMK
jgi:hypothetical protein